MSYLKKAIASALGVEIPPGVSVFSVEAERQMAERLGIPRREFMDHICGSGHVHPTIQGRIFCDLMRLEVSR